MSGPRTQRTTIPIRVYFADPLSPLDRQRRPNHESRPPRQRQNSKRSERMRPGMRIRVHLVSRTFPNLQVKPLLIRDWFAWVELGSGGKGVER